mgnify:CR=1 FL=1
MAFVFNRNWRMARRATSIPIGSGLTYQTAYPRLLVSWLTLKADYRIKPGATADNRPRSWTPTLPSEPSVLGASRHGEGSKPAVC